jgi:hypothetical protein
MLKRSIVLFSFGVAAVLFGVSQTDAQPGKGGKGKDGDIKKLESDLAQILDLVKDVQAKLERIKEGGGEKKGPGFEGKKGYGGFGKGGFGGFGKGMYGKGPEKLDPATIKEKYEYYKKLYDELPKPKGEGKKGFEGKKFKGGENKGSGSSSSSSGSSTAEARIDQMIRELQELRGELKKAKGDDKKGPEFKKGFEFKKKFGGGQE